MNPFDSILGQAPGLTLAGLAERVHLFQGRRLLVLGDLMLDEYLWGEVHRVSPEAPVPVVEARRHSFGLGGAANVVKNVLELGGRVTVAGIIGRDSHGDTLSDELSKAGADLAGLLQDSSRPTTSKLRIVAHSQQTDQQIVRVDRESRAKIDERTAIALLDLVLSALPSADAVLISDYNKGVLVPSLAIPLLSACRKAGTPVVVNPKPANLRCLTGASLVSMNHHEAFLSTLSIPPDEWESGSPVDLDSHEMLERAGKKLRQHLDCETLFITHGSRGLSVFGPGEIHHLPPIPAEVYDGTGAGDTVISVAAMTLASGGAPLEAAVLGNAGGALQVHKLGAVAISARELLCLIVEGRVESRGTT